MTYVRIRSYHVIKAYEPPMTRCGRGFDVDAETVDVLPAERSCETCLRWVAREVEKQVTGDTYTAIAEPAEDRIAL